MRALYSWLVCLCLGGLPANAQSLADALPGLWGSVSDPATSCAANPHRIDLMDSPPHAFLTWAQPRTAPDGGDFREIVFDIVQTGTGSLILRQEGRRETSATGAPLYRILRLTDDGLGYCWGRSDWPLVRCEDRQIRCDAAAPSS